MKKLLSMVLVLALAISLVAVLPAAGMADEERVTLTMLQRLNAAYVVEGNPVIDAWEDILGFNLEIEAPPISSYNDRRNIVLASGELPDIIYVGDTGSNYIQWSTQGLFVDLTEYFNEETMPNAFTCLTDDELYSVRVQTLDNHIFSMPRVQTKPADTILYRQDWLDKLGLEAPKTPEEFKAVALAFTTQDPDGNGQNDTYGWDMNIEMEFEHRNFIFAFGLHPTEVPNEDGTYTHLRLQEGYMDYLDFLRDMYAAGSLYPEFYLCTGNYEDRENFNAGKIGILSANTVIEHLITEKNDAAFQAANPDGVIFAGTPLMAEGAEMAIIYNSPAVWGNYALNADTEYLEQGLHFLDMGYTDEVNELLMFGVKDVCYTEFFPELRYASKTPEQKANSDIYVASYATINYQCHDKGLLIANGDTDEDVALFSESNNRVSSLTNVNFFLGGSSLPGVSDVNVKMTDEGIEDSFKELRTKYICGQIEKDEMVDFLQNTYGPAVQPILDIYAANNLNK